MISFLLLPAIAGPCDIYGAKGTPCVAAHSTVREMYADYSGPLYQVKKLSDNSTKDIAVLQKGGFADSKAQDSFCGAATCVIWGIYDQSPKGNHLHVAPGGGHVHQGDKPVNAAREKLMIGGNPVYGAYFEGSMGYRNDNTTDIAVGDEAQSMYMVVSGTHYNNKW